MLLSCVLFTHQWTALSVSGVVKGPASPSDLFSLQFHTKCIIHAVTRIVFQKLCLFKVSSTGKVTAMMSLSLSQGSPSILVSLGLMPSCSFAQLRFSSSCRLLASDSKVCLLECHLWSSKTCFTKIILQQPCSSNGTHHLLFLHCPVIKSSTSWCVKTAKWHVKTPFKCVRV